MIFNKAQFIWGPLTTDKITFDLDDVKPTDPYVVQGISGLEPPEDNLFIANRLVEGGIYQGRRPENREIVMLLSFQPNYSAGEDAGILRKRLYALKSPKQGFDVTFRLLDDLELNWVQTKGRIKRIEANPYSKDPQVQITMSCFSAYFEEPLFTHPSPATLSAKNPLPITNTAEVPVGFALALTLTAGMASFQLKGNLASQFIKITPAAATPFLANDKLIINTNPGSLSIVRKRTSVADLNLLPFVSSDSVWLQLDAGLNNLVPSSTAYTVDSLTYTQRHWGF